VEDGRYLQSLYESDWAMRIVYTEKGAHKAVQTADEIMPVGSHVVIMDDNILKMQLHEGVKLAEVWDHAREKMAETGLNVWGINQAQDVRNRDKDPWRVTTDLGLIYGAMFGFRASHDEKFYTKYGQIKDDLERSLRYFKADGGILRYKGVMVQKCYTPGEFKKNKAGICAHYTEETHQAESEAALKALMDEFPDLIHWPKEGKKSALGVDFTHCSKRASSPQPASSAKSAKDTGKVIKQTAEDAVEELEKLLIEELISKSVEAVEAEIIEQLSPVNSADSPRAKRQKMEAAAPIETAAPIEAAASVEAAEVAKDAEAAAPIEPAEVATGPIVEEHLAAKEVAATMFATKSAAETAPIEAAEVAKDAEAAAVEAPQDAFARDGTYVEFMTEWKDFECNYMSPAKSCTHPGWRKMRLKAMFMKVIRNGSEAREVPSQDHFIAYDVEYTGHEKTFSLEHVKGVRPSYDITDEMIKPFEKKSVDWTHAELEALAKPRHSSDASSSSGTSSNSSNTSSNTSSGTSSTSTSTESTSKTTESGDQDVQLEDVTEAKDAVQTKVEDKTEDEGAIAEAYPFVDTFVGGPRAGSTLFENVDQKDTSTQTAKSPPGWVEIYDERDSQKVISKQSREIEELKKKNEQLYQAYIEESTRNKFYPDKDMDDVVVEAWLKVLREAGFHQNVHEVHLKELREELDSTKNESCEKSAKLSDLGRQLFNLQRELEEVKEQNYQRLMVLVDNTKGSREQMESVGVRLFHFEEWPEKSSRRKQPTRRRQKEEGPKQLAITDDSDE